MRTYIYTETDSPERGYDVRISVFRIKDNQPHLLGRSDHQTASWYGARGEACGIIHTADRIPWAKRSNGRPDRYSLRDLLGFGEMYENKGQPRNAVRLFGI